jgi:hypothetical protein
VWWKSDCLSHYVIWRSKIFLSDRYEDDLDESPQPGEALSLIDAVRDRLPSAGLVSFFDVAEAIEAIPWDVLLACRRLVKEGFATEGIGKARGSFGRLNQQ